MLNTPGPKNLVDPKDISFDGKNAKKDECNIF